ncbi:restriction endonuclease subunit S [Sphaerisporangium sp. NPDC005288]|uniref:restriction endonuclease subunit S n=1 Tax=Sphaerisporangium sp. NPDC005288 TaxID=3155114 RepID=UPI0033A8F720
MSLNLDKTTWKRVRLGDVIRRSRTQADPANGDVDRYVGGGHIDSDSLNIERFGAVDDGQMGSTFTYLFKPGQVLFVSARPYLRKSGVVNFSGVVADKTYVLDAIPENGLLQEFLPFVLASDHFIAYATAEATGSMNPRLLWGQMQRYEFDLPPLDEQQRLADLLWAIERHRLAAVKSASAEAAAEAIWMHEVLAKYDWDLRLQDVVRADRPLCYGVVQPGVNIEDGVGLVRVMDLESGSPTLSQLKRITCEIDQQYRRSRIAAGDVLVSIVGTIGRTWLVTAAFEGCNIARALARISPDPELMSAEFLSWVLASKRVAAALETAAFESARKTLNLSVLAETPLPRVPVDLQASMLEHRATFAAAREHVRNEIETLLSLRASLLAELSGGTE